jgi:hypothetical protein
MTSPLLLLCLLQQLAVEPFPAEVGQEVVVRAAAAGAIAGVAVEAVLPDGGTRALGATGADGALRFVPAVAGEHRFVADIGGVRVVAPLQVLPPRRRWLHALACVPLGLVLLVRIWRSGRDGRGRPA